MTERLHDRKLDWALLALRLAGLYLALGHGWGKVAALAGGEGDRFVAGVGELGFPFPVAFAWAAALAELAGGLLVAVGLFTRIAAAMAAFTMAVAAFVRHHLVGHWLVTLGLSGASEETVKGWGNPELATIFLLVFLALALAGGGGIALDARLARRRR